MKQTFWAKKIAGFIVLAVVGVTALGFIVMGLWNSVLAPVLHIQSITFIQGLGIFLLAKILFGGFKGGGGGWKGRGRWGSEMKEKWQHMSPEEKEKFKSDWRNRCGRWGSQPAAEKREV